MKWTKEEEQLAKKEYLSMVDTLKKTEEFEHEWSGEWDDYLKTPFGKKTVTVKGDKHKFMRYWKEYQDILEDEEWDKITNENEDNYGDF